MVAVRALNDGPNWPLVITFPENVSEEYEVSVNGGRAIDADGNAVTKATPGTLLYVETNFGPEVEWIQYKSDLKGFWDAPSNPPKKNQEKQKDSGSPMLYILIAVCVICIIVTVVAYRMSRKPVGGKTKRK